ncbi:hypothetical protein CEUSTIGMA_g7126.t1 [Chlamydomonas eustigma]|uniref:GHMP kinase N-terminal domain-containing protein n=1 Tax=Chlamydomonas eustigma TaxID=1157962 RepID=A0A250X9C3_9CHLO|nr:hypothetical protein CEUSTIGMA_g7126.t1 [Chlamydomonas eustigma]|eukprot:GAX79685.1 hypothetical protein CEUSTIGMA_g7126.t1 [Chlamydomonas eustigma]
MPSDLHVIQGNTAHAELTDTKAFLDTLQSIRDSNVLSLPEEQRTVKDLFRWYEPLEISRAPGRMDVMGGIADYSGALVLQMPIAEACHVAVQRQVHQFKALQGSAKVGHITVVSFNAETCHRRSPVFSAPLSDLFPNGQPISYEAANTYFKANDSMSWASYVVGCLLVLVREEGLHVQELAEESGGGSIAIVVSSQVPEGKGVSSSAAVEVATMMALTSAFNLQIEGKRVAILSQKVENLVVGAPCGIMDQMASALGEEGRLLALLCQPAEVQGCVNIPESIKIWGIDSGIRHSVGGSDYGSVRVGAFMGLRIASEVEHEKKGLQGEVQPLRAGYLANLSPTEFQESYCSVLPESLTGAQFKAQYGHHFDTVTHIVDDNRYAVRLPATHPVYDHHRVRTFRQLLLLTQLCHGIPVAAALAIPQLTTTAAATIGTHDLTQQTTSCTSETYGEGDVGEDQACEALSLLGELMFGTHQSYSACGLGSSGTDRLVQLVRDEMKAARSKGEQPVVWGAKITGGGSGGTVCILGSAVGGAEAVQRIASIYARESHSPHDDANDDVSSSFNSCLSHPKIFEGSSMGAIKFGALKVCFN